MRRGEVRYADLASALGSEADKRRPVVLVSNDGANVAAERQGCGVVTVVPITSNVARLFAFQVRLSAHDCGLATDSKAQAEQVRSIDVRRLGEAIGRLDSATMRQLDEALRLHLGL
ncbi:type II toxin-antitoxin system PemK/MazF family toxin [Angustibacter sp. McL0619]|uniref:type II toxin-antitoxin system PemK/MazF family toxin n=1 Tax=Angustibacter sp. McL0619 TaxID=3415676 RepID=UPI003CF7DB33